MFNRPLTTRHNIKKPPCPQRGARRGRRTKRYVAATGSRAGGRAGVTFSEVRIRLVVVGFSEMMTNEAAPWWSGTMIVYLSASMLKTGRRIEGDIANLE